jgi:hypothetical protein
MWRQILYFVDLTLWDISKHNTYKLLKPEHPKSRSEIWTIPQYEDTWRKILHFRDLTLWDIYKNNTHKLPKPEHPKSQSEIWIIH